MRLTVKCERQSTSIAGTLVIDRKARIVEVSGIPVEASLGPNMLYVTNRDQPGFIGSLGSALGEAGINIATFNLGRTGPQGDAVSLLEVDQPIPEEVLGRLKELPLVVQAKALRF